MSELIKAGEHRGVTVKVRRSLAYEGREGYGKFYASTTYIGSAEGAYRTQYYDTPRAAAVDALYRNGGEAARLMIKGRMEIEYSPVVLAAYAKVVDEFGAEK